METNMQTIIDAAAQETAVNQPEAPVQPEGDLTLRLRAQELITQARTILEIARVDVFAVYNTDVDVRAKILSGQMDFIDLFKQMKPMIQPPAPMRTANGGVGTVNITGMNDQQFEKLNQMLSRGGKIDMRY
ncbi:MAG: hypothetical protein J6K55_16355 [Clostridia bacterium]|nr:hypothetical protein [Clostridia bacterium]